MKQLTKKQIEIIKRTENLICVDILKNTNARFSTRNHITVDVSGFTNLEINEIERVGRSYNLFSVVPNGYKLIALKLA